MSNKSRRKFLTDLGLTVSALSLSSELVRALPPFQQKAGIKLPSRQAPPVEKDIVDFRYAPTTWQSTYCFPDDPHKSLVGKYGDLLYSHPGVGAEVDNFPLIVTVGIKDGGEAKYIEQKMESPGIPVVTTKLEFVDCFVTLTCFATNHKDEGRVDNLIIRILSKEKEQVECTPEIIITSKNEFWLKSGEQESELRYDNESGKLFFAVKSPLMENSSTPTRRYELKGGVTTLVKPFEHFVRFPQSGQSFDDIEDRLTLKDAQELLDEVRVFWRAQNTNRGKVQWNLPDEYGNFYNASVRDIVQSREIISKPQFQLSHTLGRKFPLVTGTFLLEAASYAGFDKEAQAGLETMWNRQQSDGSFSTSTNISNWKDTAAPIYALVRQAELTQNWDYFRQLYPDAVKAMYYLKDLRDKMVNNGTANGTYKLLPQGYAGSGIEGGIRSEFTNTMWALLAINHLNALAKRFALPRRQEVAEFFETFRQDMRAAVAKEMRNHPNGFSYLPMLMRDDPQWSEADVQKQPRLQSAQIYLSQAIYPGYLFATNHGVVTGHVELMKAVTNENIPIETGSFTKDAVWSCNAAILAQVYLWLGMPELARKTFIGFLNHASPMYAWRTEQPLVGSTLNMYSGDMPDIWASAECIRYLRHMMVLEDGERLRVLDGITIDDLSPRKPLALTYSPTRWGRVSLLVETLDTKAWTVSFKREDFDTRFAPNLTSVEMASQLPGKFHFEKMANGEKYIKNGPRLTMDPGLLEWKAIFRDFRRPR